MDSFVLVLTLGVACLPAGNPDFQAAFQQSRQTADEVRRLTAEFGSAQQSALDLAEKAKSEVERKEADRALPDRRKYAQRFLDLASQTNDEAAAVDALAWVVRNGIRTPEGDQAFQTIADHYVRSDRIAGVCHSLGARGPVGGRVDRGETP